jgi:peptidoglycan/LPS O-acetylase OafA/YrhL
MSVQTVLVPAIAEPAVAEEPAAVPVARNMENLAVGSLRAFITFLVVAHHAVLAYHPFAPPPTASLVAQPRWWEAFPVVDADRWTGFSLFVGFNDNFFMALMFFLSGLFVWGSLRRKGAGAFVRDRAFRLGLPFVVAAGLIAPLAYFPAYLTTGAAPSLSGFWQQWKSLGEWPAGPAWFLWVLLAFDALAAALFAVMPRWGESLGRLTAGAARRPARFFGLLVAASALAYIPMVLAFGPLRWSSFGPFYVQTSRVFHYAVYFLAGVAVGAYGIERGLLAPDGRLAQRWRSWMSAAFATFAIGIVVLLLALKSPATPRLWGTIGGVIFALACASASFFSLAVFMRFARVQGRLFASLRANAYGIYLVHYVFVSWVQYALLRTALPALAKGLLATFGALALSWATTALLRRIPAVARVL